MTVIFRVNTAKIKKNSLEIDKNGFLRMNITFMRTGIFYYYDYEKDEFIKEYVSKEELTAPESVNSANSAIYTNDHPYDMIYPDNWNKHILGVTHSVNTRYDNETDIYYIDGIVTVYDPDEIRAIQKEEKEEISAGYWAKTIYQKGTSPKGEDYDGIQTDIFYNHNSRVWFGRAGEEAKIKKNSRKNGSDKDIKVLYEVESPDFKLNSNIITERKKVFMLVGKRDIRLNEVDEMHLQSHLENLDKQSKDSEDKLNEFKKKNSELQAELDQKNNTIKELESIDHKENFRKRNELENLVKPILKDKFDNKLSDLELKRNSLEFLYPDIDIKDKDEAYINHSFSFWEQTRVKGDPEDTKYNQIDNLFENERVKASDLSRQNSQSSHENLIDDVLKDI